MLAVQENNRPQQTSEERGLIQVFDSDSVVVTHVDTWADTIDDLIYVLEARGGTTLRLRQGKVAMFKRGDVEYLPVRASPPSDAGTSIDASSPDSGSDAGAADAHELADANGPGQAQSDAGAMEDAGAPEPGRYPGDRACGGCSTGAAHPMVLLGVLSLAWRRRPGGSATGAGPTEPGCSPRALRLGCSPRGRLELRRETRHVCRQDADDPWGWTFIEILASGRRAARLAFRSVSRGGVMRVAVASVLLLLGACRNTSTGQCEVCPGARHVETAKCQEGSARLPTARVR